MKNLYKALASAAIALLAASCVNEMGNDTTAGLFRKYNLSFEGSTKTELSGIGNTRQVKWTDGDEIKYYTVDKQPNVSTASVTASGSSAFVEIPRGRNDDFINAVYGAGSLTASSSTSDCMYVVSPAKNDQSYTTFAQAHLCAAFSSDLEGPNLRFHNAVAILKFTSAASISKVVFSGNKGEVVTGGSNGSLKITYSGGAISAAPASTGGTSVTVTTAGQESDFYIAILPVNFSEGIIVRGYDASGYLLCERKTSGELNTVNAAGLPIIANLGSIQDWLDNPKPTAVDLGLSVKWASFNLGASTPEGSGDYFSWGETAPKSSYTWSTYACGQSKNGPFSEYVVDAAHGAPDYKTILDLEDDAAHAIWGDAWRMPSKEEIQELRSNCNWQWTTMNGVAGYKVTSKTTGNFIFLPAAGMMSGSKVQNAGTEGDYWSSSLYTAESCSSWSPYFSSSQFSTGDCYRYFGLPVRAVYGEVVPVTEITLSSTSMDLLIGQTGQLTATILPDNATYKGLIWTSSDDSVATVDATGKVTAVAIGKATITAYSANDSTTAACEVTVYQLVQSITLDHTELVMYVGDAPVTLTATVLPDEYTIKNLTWLSTYPSVATVDADGKVTAVSTGSTKITVQTTDGSSVSATCTISVKDLSLPASVEAVDLGLPSGLKWATMNVGASKPEGRGEYFAWGETEPKTDYSWETYKWCNGSKTTLTKYVTDYGTVDNKTVLDPEDDAAHVNWGESWRMPTDAEWTELRENCTWTWTTQSGVQGGLMKSKTNGNSIFLPAVGYRSGTRNYDGDGYYWSSSLDTDDPTNACRRDFDSGFRRFHNDRLCGLSVRPVYGVFIPVSSVSVDKTSLELTAPNIYQLTAAVNPSNATSKDVHWSSSDESVAKVSEGLVTAVASGTATITAYGSSGVSAECMVTVAKADLSLPASVEAVDLGLPSGLKWATMNVGATRSEEYGEFFAWGETQPKSNYNWSTYKWCNGSSKTQTKYNTSSGYGTVDNKTVLDPEDDAAHVNWGGSWRMPTAAECDELINKCTCTWTTQNGVNGRLVTGPNGKSIFLPAAGGRGDADLGNAGSYGNYWSSSLYTRYQDCAWGIRFVSDYVFRSYGYFRYGGQSVRPVTE